MVLPGHWDWNSTFIQILRSLFYAKIKMDSNQGITCLSSQKVFLESFGHFTPIDAFKLFDTIVKPISCYGAEICGYEYSDEIERLQTLFCKQYIGLKNNTMDSFVLGGTRQ